MKFDAVRRVTFVLLLIPFSCVAGGELSISPTHPRQLGNSRFNGGTLAGASNGGSLVDWNNDEAITNLATCTVFPGHNQGTDLNDNQIRSDQVDATADWTQSNGRFIHFNLQFHCTAGYANDRVPR